MDLRSQLQQQLGPAYQLQRELGGGGMSRVFLATEVRFDREVVIKLLSPDLAQSINAERFEREIRLAASLQQANIVPLLAAGDCNGLPWFTMPYVEGESLRARIAREPVSISEAVAILRDVSRALAYAHARGIVHRDIKPDNVLLSGGTAVVTDFGIAKAISAARRDSDESDGATLTQLGTAIGTPAYMAPEQVAGDPDVDHRADLYALGCLAFELLTGSQPFGGRPTQKMMMAHLSETVPSVALARPDCPPALAELVQRLLEKDPADRPQSAADVLASLDAAATPTAVGPAFAPPGVWWRALVVYLVAAAAVAVIARLAISTIGLPDWVFPGAVLIMGLGVPALLLTAYIHHVARHATASTPTLTPGGSASGHAPTGAVASLALKASPHVTWRRVLRGSAYALGAFALVVAAFMGLRAAGIGPWGSLFASGKLALDDRIVVADLAVAPADSGLAPIVGEAVRAAISQSHSVRVMPPAEIAGVLQQMKRPHDLPLDAATAREVALRAGAPAVLGGRLARVGSGYAISLDLTSAQDAAMLASVQGTADGPGDLLEVVDQLTRKLRGRIGESLRQVQQTVPLARATTASLPALRKYSEAVQANDVDHDYDRAVQASREAIALDSTFALAWRKLAIALINSNGSSAQIDSALGKAAQYADRLPDREKYLALGAYYQRSRTAADGDKALSAYRAAYAADSTSYVAANNLASLYSIRAIYDSALRYTTRQQELQPTPANAGAVVIATLTAVGLDSASRVFQTMLQQVPGLARDPMASVIRASFYLTRDKRDSLQQLLVTLRRSEQVGERTLGLQFSLMDAVVHGELNRGKEYFRDLTASAAAANGGPQFGGLFDATAQIRLIGNMPAGLAIADSIVSSSTWSDAKPADRPYLGLASLYAAAGQPSRARALLNAGLAADPTLKAPDARARIADVEGDILLAEGHPADAIRKYRLASASPDGNRRCRACADYSIGVAFDRSGQADSAIAYFEQFLAVPRLERWSSDGGFMMALVEQRLGELYDARHDRSQAMAHYSAFVDLWKDADPALQPSVKSVKTRLAELASQ